MDEQKLELLKQEIKPYLPMLKKARATIMDQHVSDYPIFVFHQQHVEIGIPLVRRNEVKRNWSVNASTLEEFVTKQLIASENLEHVKRSFRDPAETYCLFVLSELGAQFIFMPEEEEDE